MQSARNWFDLRLDIVDNMLPELDLNLRFVSTAHFPTKMVFIQPAMSGCGCRRLVEKGQGGKGPR